MRGDEFCRERRSSEGRRRKILGERRSDARLKLRHDCSDFVLSSEVNERDEKCRAERGGEERLFWKKIMVTASFDMCANAFRPINLLNLKAK